MKTLIICFGLLISLVLLAGCEWTGNVDSWNESQFGTNVADYSGSYKAADGSIIVRAYTISTSTNQVTAEQLGSGDGSATAFSGALAKTPVRGTLTITVGAYRFTDSSSGTTNTTDTVSLSVTPADGSAGTFNYGTRAWALSFPAPIASGSAILASYYYLEESPSQGNHGNAIYSLIVYQVGNRLQIIDNNTSSYEGYVGAGTPSQFSVTGVSQGYQVTIVGVLQRSGTTRTMNATFIEEGGSQGDIHVSAQ